MANSELKVINAVCKNKDISTLYADNIDDLFTSYGDVWRGIKSYYDKFRAVPDFTILQEKFNDLDKIEVTGETAYYLDDLKNDFLASNMERLMKKAANDMATESPAQVLARVSGQLSSLGRYTTNVRDLDLIDYEQAEKHLEAVHERSKALGSPGIPTMFKSIDSVYPTGMAPGHMITVIGWPGKMKTWFTSLLACKAYEQGFKPMIVSLEMTPESMRDRIYTMMGDGLFRNSDFSRGDINIDDFHTWGKNRFAKKGGFIVVSNEGVTDVTPNVVQAKIEQHKPDLVICDYHQLFQNNGRSNNPTERGMAVSREFKGLAVANNIPLIDITAATQSDLSDRDSPPMMSQVAWSKSIEYDADLAFAVHKDEDSGLVEIVGRKNRHGGLFDFYLDWDIDRGIITEKFNM